MKITVIIPSFARPSDLRRCLSAVALQSRRADEVLVIGREQDPGTWSVVCDLQKELPVLRIVPVEEPGVIAALNRGLDSAAGDVLAFTDDDAEAQVDWLERIEAGFADQSIGAVGGRDWLQLPGEPALFRPAQVTQVGVLTWYGKQHGNHHCPLRGHAGRVMFLKGVNMAFSRRALGSYRIDTSLHGRGAQAGYEMDLCFQIRQAGFEVAFDDRIMVKHYCSPRTAGEGRNELNGTLFLDINFNNQYVITKSFGFWRALAYFCNERLLGSHSTPGLLACMKWHFKGDRQVWRRTVQMAGSGLAAFRQGRQARSLARRDRFGVRANPRATTPEVQRENISAAEAIKP